MIEGGLLILWWGLKWGGSASEWEVLASTRLALSLLALAAAIGVGVDVVWSLLESLYLAVGQRLRLWRCEGRPGTGAFSVFFTDVHVPIRRGVWARIGPDEMERQIAESREWILAMRPFVLAVLPVSVFGAELVGGEDGVSSSLLELWLLPLLVAVPLLAIVVGQRVAGPRDTPGYL